MFKLLIGRAEIGCIIMVILLILVPFLIMGMSALQRRAVKKQNYKIDDTTFTVKCDKVTFCLCMTVSVLFAVVAAGYLISYLCGLLHNLEIELVVFQICCYSASAVLYGISSVINKRRQITVSGDGIIFVPGLGKRREYAWEDLDYVKTKKCRKSAVYRVYVKQSKKRAFSFSSDMIGGQLFAEILRDSGLLG